MWISFLENKQNPPTNIDCAMADLECFEQSYRAENVYFHSTFGWELSRHESKLSPTPRHQCNSIQEVQSLMGFLYGPPLENVVSQLVHHLHIKLYCVTSMHEVSLKGLWLAKVWRIDTTESNQDIAVFRSFFFFAISTQQVDQVDQVDQVVDWENRAKVNMRGVGWIYVWNQATIKGT